MTTTATLKPNKKKKKQATPASASTRIFCSIISQVYSPVALSFML